MDPIRVAIIGLSEAAKASWASKAHLPYLRDSKGKYKIVALCNSSVGAANSAIKSYDLTPTTKAYGDPQELANDPEIRDSHLLMMMEPCQVDLVVCSVRVDAHYKTIKPSIEAGKDVYVEWPLASNLQEAEELNALAKDKGIRTMISLQGQLSPITLKVKSVIEEGIIGKVLSITVSASEGLLSRDSLPLSLKYMAGRSVGGNLVTIGLGHLLTNVNAALGEFKLIASHAKIQRPLVNLIKDGTVVETVNSDVPDLVHLIGVLPSGAPISINYRRGQPFKGDPGFAWHIHGENGEIKVEGPGPHLQAFDTGTKITLHRFAQDSVEEIQWESPYPELPGPAQNVASMYTAFANGVKASYPDFEGAIVRHRFIDNILNRFENGKDGIAT